jgi:predicted transcriptional regulator
MSTVELKLSLHQLIDGVNDNSVLEAIHTLLSKASAGSDDDWYTSLSDEAKASIERGLEDLKHGQTISAEEAASRISQRISKLKNA